MQSGQGFQDIKVLEVQYSSLSLFQMLSLLTVLPVLAELKSGISGLGPELENIVAEELPGHV
ncbi:hypothetical protein GGI18_004342, partial [Coemansia linderi]